MLRWGSPDDCTLEKSCSGGILQRERALSYEEPVRLNVVLPTNDVVVSVILDVLPPRLVFKELRNWEL